MKRTVAGNFAGYLMTLSMLPVFTNGSAQVVMNKTPVAIRNPVLDKNFADPTVINAGNKFYAYATQANVNGIPWNIQVASSSDLVHWRLEADALPVKPSWATRDFWAPHVLFDVALNKYVMFYSGESNDTAIGKCIGIAFSEKPTGPFRDKGTPLVCGQGFVNIDPMAFVDPKSGKKYLYWGSGFQPIRVQEMSEDWTDFKIGTSARPVVWPGKDKDYSNLIEGAWMDYRDGIYYLYYSGDNCCGTKANYAVMVAKANAPEGPFTRLGEMNGTGSSAILVKDSTWVAPGHNSIVKDNSGNIFIAFHAIARSEMEKGNPGKRVFCLLPLKYKDGWPQVVNTALKAD